MGKQILKKLAKIATASAILGVAASAVGHAVTTALAETIDFVAGDK